MLRRAALIGMILSLPGAGLQAGDGLAHVLPKLFGPTGLFVDSEATLPNGQTHSAHFNSSFRTEFNQFNVALASQLTSLPVPSPASAFTYTFDPSLGLFTRSTRSFGPILSDRAETAGKNKLSAGVSYQRFTFDSIEGIDLDDVPAVFTHDNPAPGGRDDVISTHSSIASSVDQLNVYLNYGLGSRLDVALAVPFMSNELRVVSNAEVERIGTSANHAVHFFRDDAGARGDTRSYSSGGTASGVGDVIFRVKGLAASWGSSGIGLGVDARFPTGDEDNLLGTGAMGVKPFFIFSSSHPTFSYHLNAAYQWNGESVLAGNVETGEKADLPDQFLYSGGVTIALHSNLTVVLDVIGRRIFDSPRVVASTFQALDQRTTFPNVQFETGSFNETSASVGLRFNVRGHLLMDANVLMRLDHNGLRDAFTPLVGLEYGF
jgi:hypothetical protein